MLPSYNAISYLYQSPVCVNDLALPGGTAKHETPAPWLLPYNLPHNSFFPFA